MKELTVKEFGGLVKGGLYNITSDDVWGMYVDVVGATITHSEEDNELVFFKARACEIRFDIENSIECIQLDEEDGSITIEFSLSISDVEIRKAV